jgi:hypothetical protein
MLAKVELRLLTTKDRLGCEPYRVRKARTRSTTPYSPGPNQSVLLSVDTCTQQTPSYSVQHDGIERTAWGVALSDTGRPIEFNLRT